MELTQNLKLTVTTGRCVQIPFFIFLAVSLLLVACGPTPISKIDNGDSLRADCIRLMENLPQGDIEKKLWPKSIRDLKPQRVVREENDIQIWIISHSKNGSTGYYVFPNTQLVPSTRGVWIEKTPHKGVFIFKMAY